LDKLDIVFANAGIGGATPVGQTSQAAFDEIIQTNLTAVFFTVQAAATHLNAGASIILNGSVHAVMGVPGYSAYAATKAGVRAMTRNLASEFAPRGIRVNQVTPGGTRNADLVAICVHQRSDGRLRATDSADYSARPLWRGRRDSEGGSVFGIG
jgi:NAD(P)-dependent dehydrogenase (short-subunit alcohol dehydrogenase family)